MLILKYGPQEPNERRHRSKDMSQPRVLGETLGNVAVVVNGWASRSIS